MDKKSTKKIVRKMPNNYEAEQQLLGAVLVDSEAANEVLPALNVNCFYNNSHKLIYEAMRSLNAQNKPVDLVSVSDVLEKRDQMKEVGGIDYLSDLNIMAPMGGEYFHYLEIVQRDGKLRDLVVAANQILDVCSVESDLQNAINKAEKAVFDVTYSVEQKDLISVTDGLTMSMKLISNILTNQKSIVGLETGFRNLDKIVRGYQPGQMIVLAARPGVGKTSFAMNIVSNVILSHPEKVVAVFNLEMSVEELTKRLLLSVAGVPADDLYEKKPTEILSQLWAANEKLGNTQLYIDDTTGTTPEQIMSKCRRLKQRMKRLDLVVIDYLQLLKPAVQKSNLQAEVAEVSRSIKILAKELRVPLLILSQTSRDLEKRSTDDKSKDKDPKLSDLRDSGAIEQDADQVYFLTKEEKDEDADFEVVNLHILKHRSGSTGKLRLKWQGNIVKFSDLAEAEYRKIKDEMQAAKDARMGDNSEGAGKNAPPHLDNDKQATTPKKSISIVDMSEPQEPPMSEYQESGGSFATLDDVDYSRNEQDIHLDEATVAEQSLVEVSNDSTVSQGNVMQKGSVNDHISINNDPTAQDSMASNTAIANDTSIDNSKVDKESKDANSTNERVAPLNLVPSMGLAQLLGSTADKIKMPTDFDDEE